MTDKSRVQRAPRTQIEDLPPAVAELSGDEASEVSGGYFMHIPQGIARPPAMASAQNTCTAGDPFSGADDRDYASDPGDI